MHHMHVWVRLPICQGQASYLIEKGLTGPSRLRAKLESLYATKPMTPHAPKLMISQALRSQGTDLLFKALQGNTALQSPPMSQLRAAAQVSPSGTKLITWPTDQ